MYTYHIDYLSLNTSKAFTKTNKQMKVVLGCRGGETSAETNCVFLPGGLSTERTGAGGDQELWATGCPAQWQ